MMFCMLTTLAFINTNMVCRRYSVTRDFEDYFNILHELSAKCNLKDFSNIASNVNL